MKTTNMILAIFTGLCFVSCRVNGITDDYGKLRPAEKARITDLISFENVDTSKVYRITATQLLTQMEHEDKSLVYIFKNGCKTKNCHPLFVYENYAASNGYSLYLVMNGYADLNETLIQPRKQPLYAIDAKAYGNIYRGVYTRLFKNELIGKPAEYDEYEGALFLFKNGKYEKTMFALPSTN